MDEELDSSLANGMAQAPTAYIVTHLRLMMEKAEGEDKCTLCKAAEALEKSNSNWSTWPSLMMLMLMFGTDFNNSQITGMMQAYLETLKKCNENKEDETK